MDSFHVICPHCNCPTVLLDSAIIYGQSYGYIYFCIICGAYVGCHTGSTRPLGTPADKALRTARRMAHQAFDPIWKGRCMSRSGAYAWLSQEMGLSVENTHIGMFDLAQCAKVMQICSKGRPGPT